MAHFRQSAGADDRHEHGQNGREGGDGRRSISAWEEELRELQRHLAEIAIAQNKASHSYTTTHTTSILAAGNLFRDLHLPEEAAIASAYIENNSTIASLTVYEGPGASGRVIGVVKPESTKRMALADYISSISITASAPDPAPQALVIVTLTTHKWSPTNGNA